MSRIGQKPVSLPDGVTAAINGRTVTVKGAKGELSLELCQEVAIEQKEKELVLSPVGESQRDRAMWGMQRTLVDNMVVGVSSGFTRTLEISGVGNRAEMSGGALRLKLGFSHDVVYPVPEGLQIACPRQTEVTISGTDKQRVGQAAAEIRAFRPPEPYKGKGITHAGEYVFRKEGKKK